MTNRQALIIRGFEKMGYLPKCQPTEWDRPDGTVNVWMTGKLVDTVVVTIQPDGSYRQFEGYPEEQAA